MKITDKKKGVKFEKYSKVTKKGTTQWIDVKNIINTDYKDLNVTNGSSYTRGTSGDGTRISYLDDKYIVEKEYGKSQGTPLLKIKLNGFKNE